MNEIIDIGMFDNKIDVLNPLNYSYDESQLSLTLFEASQKILLNKATKTIEKSPAFINFLNSLNQQQVFDVHMSEKAKEMYEKGEWILNYSKTKEGLVPILYDTSKNQFVEQVTLSKKNISPDLSSSLTSLAMQQQLTQLIEQLDAMNNTIQRVNRGLRDDRIAHFYSARQQYIEAISMSSTTLQAQALMNAAKTANDGRFLMMQTMRSDINQIIYNKKLKKSERDALSNDVRQAIQYINESTGLSIACFSALGEAKPMLAVAKSYQCFINETLLSEDPSGLSKAELLHQNWNGNDDSWLEIPEAIVLRLDELIDIGSKDVDYLYLEGE